jgi:hypothetical protein
VKRQSSPKLKELPPNRSPHLNDIIHYAHGTREKLLAFQDRTVKRPQRILAIDPGIKNIAAAYIEVDNSKKPIYVETIKFAATETSEFSGAMRLLYIEQMLSWYFVHYDPQVVMKEDPAHNAAFGVADAGMIAYMIERLAIEHQVPLVHVNPSTMRRFMKSKEKSDTKLNAFVQYGLKFGSEEISVTSNSSHSTTGHF